MSTSLASTRKKLKLTVTVRVMDSYRGKRVSDLLFDLFKQSGFEGATMLLADRGFDRRGFATSNVLGLSVKLPVLIETIEAGEKVLEILPRVKEIVGSNGSITLQEVEVL